MGKLHCMYYTSNPIPLRLLWFSVKSGNRVNRSKNYCFHQKNECEDIKKNSSLPTSQGGVRYCIDVWALNWQGRMWKKWGWSQLRLVSQSWSPSVKLYPYLWINFEAFSGFRYSLWIIKLNESHIKMDNSPRVYTEKLN